MRRQVLAVMYKPDSQGYWDRDNPVWVDEEDPDLCALWDGAGKYRWYINRTRTDEFTSPDDADMWTDNPIGLHPEAENLDFVAALHDGDFDDHPCVQVVRYEVLANVGTRGRWSDEPVWVELGTKGVRTMTRNGLFRWYLDTSSTPAPADAEPGDIQRWLEYDFGGRIGSKVVSGTQLSSMVAAGEFDDHPCVRRVGDVTIELDDIELILASLDD